MGSRRLPEQAKTRHAHSLWLRILRRRSPLYLHLKLYAVAALVSAVVARPISGRTCDSGVSEHEAESNLVDTSQRALNRWTDRLRDLSQVKRLVTQSSADSVRFPERHWQATVRCVVRPSTRMLRRLTFNIYTTVILVQDWHSAKP